MKLVQSPFKAEAEANNSSGRCSRALFKATRNGHREVAKCLSVKAGNGDVSSSIDATKWGSSMLLGRLPNDEVSLHAVDDPVETVPHLASFWDKIEVFQTLSMNGNMSTCNMQIL